MAKNPNAPSRKPFKRNCDVCGRYYESRSPSVCSKACSVKQQWTLGTREVGRRFPTCTCRHCGKEFTSPGYNRPKFCSKECKSKNFSLTRTRIFKWTSFQPMTWTPSKVNDGGYVDVHLPQHPRASKKGRMLEHRLVMENHLGRWLESWEHVHHRNGVKTDNRLSNLEIVTHARHHGTVVCPHCRTAFEVH